MEKKNHEICMKLNMFINPLVMGKALSFFLFKEIYHLNPAIDKGLHIRVQVNK